MTDTETPPPTTSDVTAEQYYRFHARCPVCYDQFGPMDGETEVMRAARRCYFSHDETPTPDAEEAEFLGLDGELICHPMLDGCGWEGDERTAGYSAIEFSQCPNCGEHRLMEKPDSDD